MPRLIRFERGTKVWFYDGRIIYSAYVNKIIKNVPVNVIIVGIGIDNPGDYHDDGNSLVVGWQGNSASHAGMSIIAGDTSSASKLYFGDGTGGKSGFRALFSISVSNRNSGGR